MPTDRGNVRRTPASVLLRAVLLGGFIAGLLDIADAVLFSYAWRGVSPIRVLQAISSGLLGSSAFAGGIATALLGLAIHFCIALTVAAVYAVANQRLPILARHALAAGIVYGIAVFFVMRHIVLPLSAFRGGAFAWPPFINGVLIHALGVGLPIALIVRGAGEGTATRADSAAQPREESSMKRNVMYLVMSAAIVTPCAMAAQMATPQTNTVALGGDVGFLAPDGGSGESPHLQSAVGTVDGFVEYYYNDRVSLRAMYAWSRSQLAQVPGNSLQRQHLNAHVIYSWPLGRFRPFALIGGGAYFLNTNDHPDGPGRSVIKPGGSLGWGAEFYLRTFALRSEMNVHILNDEIQFPELGGNTMTAFAWTFGIKVPF